MNIINVQDGDGHGAATIEKAFDKICEVYGVLANLLQEGLSALGGRIPGVVKVAECNRRGEGLGQCLLVQDDGEVVIAGTVEYIQGYRLQRAAYTSRPVIVRRLDRHSVTGIRRWC